MDLKKKDKKSLTCNLTQMYPQLAPAYKHVQSFMNTL